MIGHDFPYLDTRDINLDWIIKRMKQLIDEFVALHGNVDDLSEQFQRLQDYVKNYFDTLDVQEEINNKIDVMIENGTLEALFSMLYNAVKLDLDGQAFLYERLPDGKMGQGMCVANGVLITTEYADNDSATIYRVYSLATKTQLNTFSFNTLHSNSLTHNSNDNKIVAVTSGKIFIFDFTSNVMTLEETKDAPQIFTAACYDAENEIYYVMNGETREIYKTSDLETFEYIFTAQNYGTMQDMAFKDNFLYICSGIYNNYVVKYSINGTLDNLYYFNAYDFNEGESVDFYNNNMILSTTKQNSYSTYFTIPLLPNSNIEVPAVIHSPGKFRNRYNTFYIDYTADNGGDGSEEHPFNDVEIALKVAALSNTNIELIFTRDYQKEIAIRNYPYSIVLNGQNITFNERVRLYHCTDVSFAGNITFGETSYDVQLQIENCGCVTFAGTATFNNQNPNIRVSFSMVVGRGVSYPYVTGTNYVWFANTSSGGSSGRFDGTNGQVIGLFGQTPCVGDSMQYSRKSHTFAMTGLTFQAGVTDFALADYLPAYFPASQVNFAAFTPIYTPQETDQILIGYNRGDKIVHVYSMRERTNQTIIVFVST